MIKINIQEAKTHLSRYLAEAERGERVVLCRRNVPVAELKPLGPAAADRGERPLGVAKGQIIIHDSFYDPLSDDLLKLFNGEAEEEA